MATGGFAGSPHGGFRAASVNGARPGKSGVAGARNPPLGFLTGWAVETALSQVPDLLEAPFPFSSEAQGRRPEFRLAERCQGDKEVRDKLPLLPRHKYKQIDIKK